MCLCILNSTELYECSTIIININRTTLTELNEKHRGKYNPLYAVSSWHYYEHYCYQKSSADYLRDHTT